MMNRVDERIDEGFGNVEIMEDDRIAKRFYVGECASSYSVGRPRKRWTDTMKGLLEEKMFGCQANKKNGAW